MSQNKFTPGPWSVPNFADSSGCQYVFSDSQSGFGSIATVNFGGEDEPCEQAKANAQLISAAPDMLAALEKGISRLETCIEDERYMREGSMNYLLEIFKEAVAKARGDNEQA